RAPERDAGRARSAQRDQGHRLGPSAHRRGAPDPGHPPPGDRPARVLLRLHARPSLPDRLGPVRRRLARVGLTNPTAKVCPTFHSPAGGSYRKQQPDLPEYGVNILDRRARIKRETLARRKRENLTAA